MKVHPPMTRAELESATREAWRRAFKPARKVGAVYGAGLLANAVLRLDRDPCASGARVCFRATYRDVWSTPDKRQHFAAGYYLANGALWVGTTRRQAFALACGTGIGFEFTQGYVSGKDIAADCAGALASVTLSWLWEHKLRGGGLHR
jgi:uncharacterized protein YfiM (DUF2279 family)